MTDNAIVLGGDCMQVLRDMESELVHSIVTDPPYGLSEVDASKLTTALTAWVNGDRERVPSGKGFMGKEWDAFVPPPAVFDECLRVLKPGGHMLVFAGSRTVDLMGLSIRLAGFEIRDTLQWLYGSGFPKSMNVAKAIESGSGRPEDIRRMSMGGGYTPSGRGRVNYDNGSGSQMNGSVTEFTPATDAARVWEGWGTALKPAAEPILLARKPFATTVAKNVLAHGVGALNIDGCRVGYQNDSDKSSARPQGAATSRSGALAGKAQVHTCSTSTGASTTVPTTGTSTNSTTTDDASTATSTRTTFTPDQSEGRFPANVLLSHNEGCTDPEDSDRQGADAGCELWCPVAELDAQSADTRAAKASGSGNRVNPHMSNSMSGVLGDYVNDPSVVYTDSGGASRFFPTFRYQAKAPKRERPKVDGVSHPTVKPVALMRWLVRLITPPGGTVLDPFAGSGTTLQAASEEGFASIGIERDPEYLKLISARLGFDSAEDAA